MEENCKENSLSKPVNSRSQGSQTWSSKRIQLARKRYLGLLTHRSVTKIYSGSGRKTTRQTRLPARLELELLQEFTEALRIKAVSSDCLVEVAEKGNRTLNWCLENPWSKTQSCSWIGELITPSTIEDKPTTLQAVKQVKAVAETPEVPRSKSTQKIQSLLDIKTKPTQSLVDYLICCKRKRKRH